MENVTAWARFATSRKQLCGQGARGAHEEAVGLLLVARGAPEAADIDVKLEPSRLARNCRHCCLPSSQGEQIRFSKSHPCRRWSPRRKPRSEGPYTPNSGEPAPRDRPRHWPERRPPAGVIPNRPLANQRPRLEPTVPLRFIKILPLIKILDSLTLGRSFYFLRQGKHTLSRSNLVRPSRVERPTLNTGSVDPWAEHRGPGPCTYTTEFSLGK
jgi:hypothetical protein